MHQIGEAISWMTVHGVKSGTIERIDGEECFVRLSSGKAVIVHEDSIIKQQGWEDT